MNHFAFRQSMPDEYGLDGLQVIFGSQVHYGKIFIIEVAMLVDEIAIALDQIAKQILVGVHVAVEIHCDEAIELQKARINGAPDTRMRKWHSGDDMAAEPLDAALFGELVDCGRIAAGIDRAAHQGH